MSTELKPCPFCGAIEAHVRENEIGGYTALCYNCTAEGPLHETKALAAEWWNRRTAPVSAPLDTQALPQLPDTPRAITKHPNLGDMFDRIGLHAYAIKYASAAIAPYAERIRQLERELAERKPATSIGDDRAFQRLLVDFGAARFQDVQTTRERVIAYIDGRTAGVAPDGWREFIEGCAQTAGGMVNGNRLSSQAKQLLAAAPSSMSKGKEEA